MVEQAVKNVIFINGRSVKRPLIIEDGRRFTSYLLQPPRSLTQAELGHAFLQIKKRGNQEAGSNLESMVSWMATDPKQV